MKAKYYFFGLLFLFCGCKFLLICGDGSVSLGEAEYKGPRPQETKHFIIINRTDNEYKNNFLTSLASGYLEDDITKKWKLYYYDGSKKNFESTELYFNKIVRIAPNETVKKNEKDEVLRINMVPYISGYYHRGEEDIFWSL